MKDSRPRVYWLDDEGIRKNLPNLTEGQLGVSRYLHTNRLPGTPETRLQNAEE